MLEAGDVSSEVHEARNRSWELHESRELVRSMILLLRSEEDRTQINNLATEINETIHASGVDWKLNIRDYYDREELEKKLHRHAHDSMVKAINYSELYGEAVMLIQVSSHNENIQMPLSYLPKEYDIEPVLLQE